MFVVAAPSLPDIGKIDRSALRECRGAGANIASRVACVFLGMTTTMTKDMPKAKAEFRARKGIGISQQASGGLSADSTFFSDSARRHGCKAFPRDATGQAEPMGRKQKSQMDDSAGA